MNTARPASDCRSSGSMQRINWKFAVTLTAITSVHGLRSMWPSGDDGPAIPALPTRMSSLPWRSCSAAPSRAMPSESVILSGTSVALPPAAVMASSSSSSPPWVRATAITCAPAFASASAVAWPMPREAPVTRAMREARGFVIDGTLYARNRTGVSARVMPDLSDDAKGQWRPMQISDLRGVLAVADEVHPAFPEDATVFEERLRLYPAGCLVFSQD